MALEYKTPAGLGFNLGVDDLAGDDNAISVGKIMLGAPGDNDGFLSSAAPMPISAASMPLPTGASSSALQGTANTALAAIQAAAEAAQASLEALDDIVAGSEAQVDVVTVPADPFGANADAVVAAGDPGSISAKLRRLTTDLDAANQLLTTIDSDTSNLTVISAGTSDLANALQTFDSQHLLTDKSYPGSMVRDDALSTVTPIEGDYMPFLGDSEGALWSHEKNSDDALTSLQLIDDPVATISSTPLFRVAIFDNSDNQVTSFGAGVQYTEGATDASITGTAVMWEDTSETLRAVSAAKPFPVEIIAGAGSGGTSIQDLNGTFTPGTTSFNLVGGYRDDTTPSTAAEGEPGAARITEYRGLHVALHDSSGNELSGALTELSAAINSNRLDVNIAADGASLATAANQATANSSLSTIEGAVAAEGAMQVLGLYAHDAPATNSAPVIQGGYASGSEPSAVAAGDAVRAYYDTTGYQFVKLGGTALTHLGNLAGTVSGSDLRVTASEFANLTTLAGTVGTEDDTAPTTPLVIAGRFDSAARSLEDGDTATLACDSEGRLQPIILTPAGDSPWDDTLDALKVNVVNAGTEYNEGDTNPTFTGTVLLAEAPSDTAKPFLLDASQFLRIAIASDEVGIGGGTQYTDDTDTHSTGVSVGNLMMAAATPTDGSVGANDIGALAMSLDRRLHTDAQIVGQDAALDVSAATVPVSNTGLTDLAAAINASRMDINIAADAVGLATSSAQSTANTSLSNIESAVVNISSAIFTEDGLSAGGEKGMLMLGVRRDADTSPVSGDSDYQHPVFDARGLLKVEAFSGETLPVSGSGTFTIQEATALDVSAATVTVDLGADNDVVVSTNTTGGATPNKLISAASTNATSVKGSAGTLYMLTAMNTNAAARYLKLYDKASAPTVGTDTPVQVYTIPGRTAGGGVAVPIPTQGIAFATGIALAITTGAPDSDTGAVAADEIVVSYGYA